MGVVLENLPVDKDTKAVLLRQPTFLSPVYELMQAVETGEWQDVKKCASDLKLPESFIAESHWNAMQWAKQMNSGV